MESYFRLDSPLYFSYSHLVCRTAIEGGPPSPPSAPPRHRPDAEDAPFVVLGSQCQPMQRRTLEAPRGVRRASWRR